jgi:hypothetical protein
MRTQFRKNNIVVHKDFYNNKWKTFFIVKHVEGKYLYCNRCSVNAPVKYLYTLRKEDVQILKKANVPMCKYVKEQLCNIKQGETQTLFLKITIETQKLLKDKYQILCLYKRSAYMYIVDMFEIKRVSTVYLNKIYKSRVEKPMEGGVMRWIKLTIGPKIQRHTTNS